MREILFKAKRIDNGEWVEGSYIKSQPINEYVKTNASMIICENGKGKLVQIDETTICQYTGLTDKNGNKIWENDVLKGYSIGRDLQDLIPSSYKFVHWDNDTCSGWKIDKYNLSTKKRESKGIRINKFDCDLLEVIGNIFDNPELVKGGAT